MERKAAGRHLLHHELAALEHSIARNQLPEINTAREIVAVDGCCV